MRGMRVHGETSDEYRRRYQRARYGALSQLATEFKAEFTALVQQYDGYGDQRNVALRALGRRHPERLRILLARHINRSTAHRQLELQATGARR